VPGLLIKHLWALLLDFESHKTDMIWLSFRLTCNVQDAILNLPGHLLAQTANTRACQRNLAAHPAPAQDFTVHLIKDLARPASAASRLHATATAITIFIHSCYTCSRSNMASRVGKQTSDP
jgi:hypothetical protein